MAHVNSGLGSSSRKVLPDRRRSHTVHAHIGGVSVFLTCGEYEDGSLGEIFVDASKFGTFARGALDAFAKCFSIALQCGAELRCMIACLEGTNFPPNDESCKSIIDWVVKYLGATYGSAQRQADNRGDGEAAIAVPET